MKNNPFKYCPNCNSEDTLFVENKRFNCNHCGFEFYQNVAGATAVILYYETEILFTVRNEDPQIGKLDLPGGFIDPNETVEEGVKRELYEELGISIDIDKLKYVGSQPNIYSFKNIEYNTIDLYFTYPLNTKEINFNKDEISELNWLYINDLNLDELAFKSHRNFFKLNQKKLLW